MKQYNYYVYILGNAKPVLYIGVTKSLKEREWEYKNQVNPGSFVEKYKCFKLLHFEHFTDINSAIAREKQLKRWHREWKLNLIKEHNPTFRNLFEDFK